MIEASSEQITPPTEKKAQRSLAQRFGDFFRLSPEKLSEAQGFARSRRKFLGDAGMLGAAAGTVFIAEKVGLGGQKVASAQEANPTPDPRFAINADGNIVSKGDGGSVSLNEAFSNAVNQKWIDGSDPDAWGKFLKANAPYIARDPKDPNRYLIQNTGQILAFPEKGVATSISTPQAPERPQATQVPLPASSEPAKIPPNIPIIIRDPITEKQNQENADFLRALEVAGGVVAGLATAGTVAHQALKRRAQTTSAPSPQPKPRSKSVDASETIDISPDTGATPPRETWQEAQRRNAVYEAAREVVENIDIDAALARAYGGLATATVHLATGVKPSPEQVRAVEDATVRDTAHRNIAHALKVALGSDWNNPPPAKEQFVKDVREEVIKIFDARKADS